MWFLFQFHSPSHQYLGSSWNLVGGFWFEVEFPAVEEYSCAVVLESMEASGRGFDRLNTAVETFTGGVGDSMTEVSQGIGVNSGRWTNDDRESDVFLGRRLQSRATEDRELAQPLRSLRSQLSKV